MCRSSRPPSHVDAEKCLPAVARCSAGLLCLTTDGEPAVVAGLNPTMELGRLTWLEGDSGLTTRTADRSVGARAKWTNSPCLSGKQPPHKYTPACLPATTATTGVGSEFGPQPSLVHCIARVTCKCTVVLWGVWDVWVSGWHGMASVGQWMRERERK